MKKRMILIALILIFVFNLNIMVQAKSDVELIEDIKTEYDAELAKIQQTAKENEQTSSFDINYSNSFPLYYYRDVYGEEYDETFASHLSTYIWRYCTGSHFLDFRKDEGENDWSYNGGSSTIPTFPDKDDKPIEMSFSMQAFASEAAQKIGGNIEDLKIVYFEYTYMIYVLKDGNEYVITYGARPEFTGLQNGKVYSASEAVNSIIGDTKQDATSVTINSDKNELTGGGMVGNQMTSEEQMGYGGGATTTTSDNTSKSEQTADTEISQPTETTPKDAIDTQILSIIILSVLVVGAIVLTVISLSKHKKR